MLHNVCDFVTSIFIFFASCGIGEEMTNYPTNLNQRISMSVGFLFKYRIFLFSAFPCLFPRDKLLRISYNKATVRFRCFRGSAFGAFRSEGNRLVRFIFHFPKEDL